MKVSDSIINFGAYSLCNYIEYKTEGVPFLNVGNIKENIIDLENVKLIDSNLSHTLLWKSLVKENQVLLTIAGTIGNAVVANNLPANTNSNQAIANINLKLEIVSPYYISTFLNCKYGKMQTTRLIISNVQPNLLLNQVKKIQVPIFSRNFQSSVEEIVKNAHCKLNNSKKLYTQAENLLIAELGLENFNPSNEKVSIKSLKESFLKTGRLDSEYYQVKYDEIMNRLINYGCVELENFVDSYTTGYPYSSDSFIDADGIPLIKISNINNFNLDISNASFIPKKDLNLSIENIVKKNDILVSMSGTIGNSCMIQDNLVAVVNQRIMKIKSKNILPIVLSLIIDSLIGKNQLERIQTGGVQANISAKDILKIQIPILRDGVQDEIASYIKQSIEYSKKAKELLKISTKAVEIAIEKDEEMARNLLERQTDRQTDRQIYRP